jgi:methyl coenzyme M reductase beta subunit
LKKHFKVTIKIETMAQSNEEKRKAILSLTPEQTAKMFGVPVFQIKKQYAVNLAGLKRMLHKARLTGKKVNGYTEDDLVKMVEQYSKLAK